jgi:hypothetical protein
MLDRKGKLIRVGHHLKVGGDWAVGIVVCSMDTGEYSTSHPKEEWAYLERGIMVQTDKAGLIHYVDNDQEIEVIDTNSD